MPTKADKYFYKQLKVNAWWNSLDESEKLDVLESIYPDQVGLIDSDELWMRTDWNIKLEAHKEAK